MYDIYIYRFQAVGQTRAGLYKGQVQGFCLFGDPKIILSMSKAFYCFRSRGKLFESNGFKFVKEYI